ncbi:endonuclease/exonuclease/phosphatase family protein [Roseibium polysiphoniae]|uniref:Endonuclease/exonuclease/phosphatase family protein n=1 Tax=Roseibium polysiphoniae TaxID=2571221 RepID=A0A944CHM1_9HYPH|nr:endonuclease/exonuclease/phosphatase family protein [Roseibium polysiphoniae]MBS8261963.1 endonuclease/exonuclease/phosphatase family protein [Roseibium polysiphoniae]
MRLATFNLESFGEDRFRPDNLGLRLSALRPRLIELDADILCLQEVNAQKPLGEKRRDFAALDLLLAETPYADFNRAAGQRPDLQGPADRHNLLVLSRYPIDEVQVLYHARVEPPLWRPKTTGADDIGEDLMRFDRPILQVKLDIGAEQFLHLFVVHLRAPIAAALPGGKCGASCWKSSSAWAEGYFLSAMKRTAQALDLRLAIDAVLDKEPDALIAAAGDFNATGDASALRLICADPEDTGNQDLAGRQMYQVDESLPAQERRTVLHGGRGQVLDHIVVSSSLRRRLTGIHVFNEQLADELKDAETDAREGSFHAAVCAELAL